MKLEYTKYFIQNKFAGKQVEITCRTKMWKPRIDMTYLVNADDVVFQDMETFTSLQCYVPNLRRYIHTSNKGIVNIREAKQLVRA